MRWLVPAVGLLGAACAADGGVHLRLELPADPALDPLAGAATLRLIARAGGEVVHTAVVAAPGAGDGIDFGEVPARGAVAFEVAGLTAGGRVVGFGRAGPIALAPEATVEVAIPVRRPFAYLAGGDALLAIDATREPGETAAATIEVGGAPAAVAITADAAEVVVATAEAVRLVPTDRHAARPGAAPLPAPPTDLAVSADGRRAIVTHAAAGRISIVDLDALRAGAPTAPTVVDAVRPGPVAIDGDVAWVLDEPLDNLFCAGRSRVRAIPLGDPGAAPAPIELDGPASDVAAAPGGAALVTLPCAGEVRWVAAGAPSRVALEVAGPSSVTVAAGRVWAAGHVDGADAHLILASAPLAGGAARALTLPTTVERAIALDLARTGQDGLIEITADLSSAFHLAALPDGAHVAWGVTAGYLTEPAGDAGDGRPVVPALTMITQEYQLVQLDTGLAAQRLRVRCDLTWQPGALLDDFACARAPGQDVLDGRAPLTDLAALHGSR